MFAAVFAAAQRNTGRRMAPGRRFTGKVKEGAEQCVDDAESLYPNE